MFRGCKNAISGKRVAALVTEIPVRYDHFDAQTSTCELVGTAHLRGCHLL
jgi:hypothetical protein